MHPSSPGPRALALLLVASGLPILLGACSSHASGPPAPPSSPSAAPSTAPVAVASAAARPPAPAAAPTAAPPPSKGAPKPASAACAAGTTLVWVDGAQTASCMRPCDNTKGCGSGQPCLSAGVAGDDGNPIPHDIVSVCPATTATTARPTAPAAVAAPAPGTMEVVSPGHTACPAGYGDQGLLDSCNKSCTTDRDCAKPFTCRSLGGDPPHNCVDLAHLHMQGSGVVSATGK